MRSTQARPMPIAAPVTMATFPDSLAMTCSAVVFF
jgi:hypothetical protein